MPTIGRQIPMQTNERQLRSLAKAELEPTVQADVWQQAVQKAGWKKSTRLSGSTRSNSAMQQNNNGIN